MRATLRSVAIRALAAIPLLFAMTPAHAQTAHNFDLPAQPLADALRAVASATRINIVFDPAVVAGIEAPALRGSDTAREALAKLLVRTGLRYVAVDDSTVRIARITDRDPITARARASGPVDEPGVSDSPAASGHPTGNASATATRAAGPGPAQRRPSPRDGVARTADGVELSEVVVTGTRIGGVVPASPVITFDREAIDASGFSSVGQFLLAVPENFSGGQNPGVVGARGNNQFSISGASSANLLGLGADSTLTLVDGHRLAYDAYQNGVDLSMIPLAAVDRIEILTDGASAIYGSDAVAGVVNVILKQHYDGITADARYGDVTSGHASRAQYSLLAGHGWGSGNAVIAYEYAHDNPLEASERAFSAGSDQPFYLLPQLNRDSVFLTAHQGLSSAVTVSLDALYTSRSYVGVFTVGAANAESIDYADVGVREYGVSPGITMALGGKWQLSLEGTLSSDRDKEISPQISGVTNRLLSRAVYSYRNDLRIVDLQATGPLVTLPSGALKIAMGAGYRHESFDHAAPSDPSAPPINASRDVRFAYLEADVPLVAPDATRLMLKRLSLSAALRYERYSDFGAQHTPKVGVAYTPVQWATLRATWSESFRAPELVDVAGDRNLYLEPSALIGGRAGTTTLISYGSNPVLGPETSTSKTVSLDITPEALPRLKVTSTYFYIRYSDRLVQPIADFSGSLANPLYAPFTVVDPTPAAQQTLISQSTFFTNFSGAPYDPATVAYYLDDEYTNATVQRVHGVDLAVQDGWPVLGGDLSMAASGAWLTLLQRTVSGVPQVRLSGTIFNPPNFKGRATATWRRAGWALTAALNYVSPEWDDSNPPQVRVASWSTVDAQVSYGFDALAPGWLRGLKASLAVENVFDRAPPFVASTSTTYPGLGYDSTNASPLGRFVSVYLSKSW
jgi:iron complex outermembrane recepter protein